MGEAIGYYNSITTHRYHKETIRHSFTAHYIISLRCTLFEFYIPKSTGIAPTQAMYYRVALTIATLCLALCELATRRFISLSNTLIYAILFYFGGKRKID